MVGRAEPAALEVDVGSPAVGVRTRSQPGGGDALAEDLASVEGVRPAPAGPDPSGVGLQDVGPPDRAGSADRREPGAPSDRRVQPGRDGLTTPSYRGRASEEER